MNPATEMTAFSNNTMADLFLHGPMPVRQRRPGKGYSDVKSMVSVLLSIF
jgi:hypothetical protein